MGSTITIPETHQTCETLIDVLEYGAQYKPDTLIYQFLTEAASQIQTLSYQGLAQKAKAIALTLKKSGVEKGERAILIYEPGLELIAAYFGCLYAGVIAVPVYPPLNVYLVEKLQRVIENSESRVLLTSSSIQKKLQQLKFFKSMVHLPFIKNLALKYGSKKLALTNWDLEKLTWITTDNIDLSFAKDWKLLSISQNDLAFLQYTSGSTAHPKGVMISHGNLLDNLSILHRVCRVNKESVGMNWLPPYHDMGLIGTILLPFFVGFKSILMPPLIFLRNPKKWLQAITDYQATIMAAPNFAYDYCVKKISDEDKKNLDLASWKVAINGAEPIHVQSLENFYQSFKQCGFRKEAFMPSYGLAEATLYVSGASYFQGYKEFNYGKKRIVSCGQPSQQVIIVNPDSNEVCEEHKEGEIWIKGPSVAKGYWGLPEETKKTFHANQDYLRTGDLGFLYQGELFVTGRIKDLIIIHGKNYYPQDFELTAEQCHSQLRKGAVAAFSIAEENEEQCVIVAEINSAKNYKEIAALIAERIWMVYECPVAHIIFISPRELPKTTSGKLRRKYTKELFESNQLPMLYHWQQDVSSESFKLSENPIESELQKMCYELMNRSVGIQDNLAELGVDSLLATQILSRIRAKFEIELPIQDLFACKTLKELAEKIKREQK